MQTQWLQYMYYKGEILNPIPQLSLKAQFYLSTFKSSSSLVLKHWLVGSISYLRRGCLCDIPRDLQVGF
jgi:hypothetical protein